MTSALYNGTCSLVALSQVIITMCTPQPKDWGRVGKKKGTAFYKHNVSLSACIFQGMLSALDCPVEFIIVVIKKEEYLILF